MGSSSEPKLKSQRAIRPPARRPILHQAAVLTGAQSHGAQGRAQAGVASEPDRAPERQSSAQIGTEGRVPHRVAPAMLPRAGAPFVKDVRAQSDAESVPAVL